MKTGLESLEILRRLAKTQPARYGPNLAWTLHNLAICYTELEDNPAALDAIHRAVDVYRRLHKRSQRDMNLA